MGQNAGDGSEQYQAGRDIHIHAGMTEERVRALIEQRIHEVAHEYAAESLAIAEERMSKLNDDIVSRLSATGRLGALADPAVHTTVRKALVGAATTEREDDYQILGSLVEQRCQDGRDRSARVAIDRAVQVVAEIDTAALSGLRLLTAALTYSPQTGNARYGLASMNHLLNNVMGADPLPSGKNWIDHLDILGAVRVSSLGKLRDVSEIWALKLPGYVSSGVESGSERAAEGYSRLAKTGVHLRSTAHEFREGFERLPFVSKEQMATDLTGLDEAQVAEALQIADDYFGFSSSHPDAVERLMVTVREMSALAKFCDWYETIDGSFSLTAVGRVLGDAGVRRRGGSGLPPLSL